jgi:hypothetical protein
MCHGCFHRLLRMVASTLFACLAAGCCHDAITPLNVTVSLDDPLRSGTNKLIGQMQVDLVAISPNEHPRCVTYSMTKYWEPNDPMRKFVPVHTATLDADHPVITLAASDPQWDKWIRDVNVKDPPRLYVLVNVRGRADDQPGDLDCRRKILPLTTCHWDKNLGSPPHVQLTVNANGLVVDTLPRIRD